MKLYELNSRCKVRVLNNEEGPPAHKAFQQNEILTYYHTDGMYSYCRDINGHVVHLPAFAEVEIVTDNSGTNQATS